MLRMKSRTNAPSVILTLRLKEKEKNALKSVPFVLSTFMMSALHLALMTKLAGFALSAQIRLRICILAGSV